MFLQLLGVIIIAASAVLAALCIGAKDGWATPFASREQAKLMWSFVRDGIVIGVCLIVIGLYL